MVRQSYPQLISDCIYFIIFLNGTLICGAMKLRNKRQAYITNLTLQSVQHRKTNE